MSDDPEKPKAVCPVCGAELPEDPAAAPFCSSRCRTIDMGRWLDERYTVSRPLNQADLEE